MSNTHRDIDADKLDEYALQYCDECIDAVKQIATNSGKVLDVKERHLPTIDYFLKHWLRRKHKEFWEGCLKRSQWYNAQSDSEHPLSDTIKIITENFHALSKDIVANEGKGIFYAKNALGMTDRTEQTLKGEVSPFKSFDIDVPEDDSTG
jgi:restriction endonuclease